MAKELNPATIDPSRLSAWQINLGDFRDLQAMKRSYLDGQSAFDSKTGKKLYLTYLYEMGDDATQHFDEHRADFLHWIGICSQLSHPGLVPFCGYWAAESYSERDHDLNSWALRVHL
jgi:hypothetical protein